MNYANGGLIDSTSNDIDCNTVLGNPAYQQSGKMGYAIDFEKSESQAFEDGDNFDGMDELTVEAWINLESYHILPIVLFFHMKMPGIFVYIVSLMLFLLGLMAAYIILWLLIILSAL